MSASRKRDILSTLRLLTTEKLDRLRLKIWKRFGQLLRKVESKHDPDELLRKIVGELVEGRQICPGERIDPPTCLLDLVERRVDNLAKKRLKIQKPGHQRQPIPEQSIVNINDMPIKTIREELHSLGGEIEPFYAKIADILGIHKLYTDESIEVIIEKFWKPIGAGQPRTSASVSKQEHSFVTEEGTVKIECLWEERHNDEPAYVWLSWEVHNTTEKELWILFLDHEIQGIYYEVNLGTDLTGETTFIGNELGFDPSSEEWAISVMLQEMG